MKKFFFFILILISFQSKGQGEKDTANLSIAFSSFILPENSVYLDGCYAIGPTILLNVEKFSFGLSFLYDLNEYYSYFNSARLPSQKGRTYHYFLGILADYKYFKTRKFDFLAEAGLYLVNKPEHIDKSIYLPLRIGMGVSYRFLNHFNYTVIPSFQFIYNDLYPGLLMDLKYSFD